MDTSDTAPDHDHNLTQVLERLDSLTDRKTVSVREVLDRFGATAFLPVLMIPALLVTSPLSGVPLFSTICGLSIGTIALQLLLGRDHLWLPDTVMRRTIEGVELHNALKKMSKAARWMDGHTRRRLSVLTGRAGQKVVYLACTIGGFSMPLLEIIPFSSSGMGFAILSMCLGLLAVDGIFILLGLVVMGGVATIPVFVYSGVSGLFASIS
ncbi:exopolysaccharide biosynthesis protein [Maribius pontilimi]|uniref:Exopolysaccharide biosynthesis protein n=1 Tax=Palleronia pontilimi TaxID=1964209 RepID=A0A934MI35_9RHOB|nr:exopolysaccharide biosynthesis protein [Palleronia pontilimi]MBJ3763879.1 exopolysaccharide biosynthesis protein [Palleronia pontilimi]